MRERLEYIAQNTHGFLIPRDLNYLRQRARKRGDRSIGLVGATLGSALDIKPILRGWRGNTEPMSKARGFDSAAEMLFEHIEERVRNGLLVPAVALSYGGDLSVMRDLPGYDALRQHLRRPRHRGDGKSDEHHRHGQHRPGRARRRLRLRGIRGRASRPVSAHRPRRLQAP